MDDAHRRTRRARPGPRPQVFIECDGASVALDPVGYLDREVADTLLRIASTLDEVVGLDGHVIRLRRATGVSGSAWSQLLRAGWEPIDRPCDGIVLRRHREGASN